MPSYKIDGLSPELDGTYDVVVPTVGDQRMFRLASHIGPAEMTEILEHGSPEAGALMLFAALRRAGKVSELAADDWRREDLVKDILELPMDKLAALLDIADTATDEGDAVIPPANEPATLND